MFDRFRNTHQHNNSPLILSEYSFKTVKINGFKLKNGYSFNLKTFNLVVKEVLVVIIDWFMILKAIKNSKKCLLSNIKRENFRRGKVTKYFSSDELFSPTEIFSDEVFSDKVF